MSGEPGDAKNDLFELDEPEQPADDEPDPIVAAPGSVQRPTVIPRFDPRQHAEDLEFRERMPTLTDDSALEEARLQSFPTRAPPAPPPRGPMSTVPGPLVGKSPDSSAEVDVGEDDIAALGADEQVAILRARLMPLSRVPALLSPLSEIGAAIEDPKTAYVVGFVDGILPLDTIIDVTGLPELDTLRVLDRLVGQGIVVFRSSASRR